MSQLDNKYWRELQKMADPEIVREGLTLTEEQARSILGFTGPRKLSCNRKALYLKIKEHYKEIQPTCVISGMALGSDLLAARAALDEGIHVVAAIPHEEQDKGWTDPQKAYRNEILAHPNCQSVLVNRGPAESWKYFKRNEWIVDHSHQMLGVNPNKARSGTGHCLRYAASLKRAITKINPELLPI